MDHFQHCFHVSPRWVDFVRGKVSISHCNRLRKKKKGKKVQTRLCLSKSDVVWILKSCDDFPAVWAWNRFTYKQSRAEWCESSPDKNPLSLQKLLPYWRVFKCELQTRLPRSSTVFHDVDSEIMLWARVHYLRLMVWAERRLRDKCNIGSRFTLMSLRIFIQQ